MSEGILESATLGNLRTGHSHEDIDGATAVANTFAYSSHRKISEEQHWFNATWPLRQRKERTACAGPSSVRLFGSLALFIVRHCKEAQPPADFSTIIKQWIGGAQRPHERLRFVLQVDQHRDWYIWIHLVDFHGKCRLVYHSLSVWVCVLIYLRTTERQFIWFACDPSSLCKFIVHKHICIMCISWFPD